MDKRLPTVLVVDDHQSMRETMVGILKKDFRVFAVSDGETALEFIKHHEIHIVFLDIMLPKMNGIDVLKIIKEKYEDVEVVIISIVKKVETVVEAIKNGAVDYITKDFAVDDLIAMVNRIINKQQDKKKLLYLRSEIDQIVSYQCVIGQNEKMREIVLIAERVAGINTTVLICGESGTGKEVLARMIYTKANLKDAPFVTISLPSVPSNLLESILFGHEKGAFTGAIRQHIGKFELAHRGFLFLDEISELPYDLQAKLLRAIQEGEIERVGGNRLIQIDIRLIASTNVNLREAVTQGKFREDLFYRLNVIPIQLPPLRERVEDIPELVDFFIKRYNIKFNKKIKNITDSALAQLQYYQWPGNIRELENFIERIMAISDKEVISLEDLPLECHLLPNLSYNNSEYCFKDYHGKSDFSLKNARDVFEKNFIIKVLEQMNWNRQKTADVLGISKSSLKLKIKQLKIENELIKDDWPD